MRNPSNSELTGLVYAQQAALHELIDIALSAARESGDSSVGTIHLITRLNKLENALRRAAVPFSASEPHGAIRH